MRRMMLVAAILGLAVLIGAPSAMAGDGKGSGWAHAFNWFRDADGDGIPNGLDPDWVRPYDGDGYSNQNWFRNGSQSSTDGEGTGYRNRYRYEFQTCINPDSDGDRVRQRLRNQTCLD